MNHVVLPALCLGLLIVSAPLTHAQPAAETQAAIEAAVRRQSTLNQVREFIGQGRAAEADRNVVAAAQAYNKAVALLRDIPGADLEQADAIAGLSRTTLALADISMRQGNYFEARSHIDRVLKEDPRNQLALEMRIKNDRFLDETKGRTPHPEAIAIVAANETNRIEVGKLVQDGKIFYEAGRLSDAENALGRALRIDPANKPAAYYLDLVHGRRYLEELRMREVNSKGLLLEIEKQWADPVKRDALPVPNPYARTNIVYSSDLRQKTYQKLRTIRLNELLYDGLPLSEVIKQLNDEAKKRDIELKGVNFLLAPNADTTTAPPPTGLPGAGGAGQPPAAAIPPDGFPAAGVEPFDLPGVTIRIATPLRDLTLEEALNVITMVADKRIKYSVEDFGVVISPRATEPVPLHTRFFKVDPNTFWQGLANVVAFSFGESSGGGGGGGGGGRGGGRGGGSRGGGGRGGNQFGGGGGQNGESGGGATYAGVSIAGGGGQQFGGGQQQGGGGVGAFARTGQQGAGGAAVATGTGGGIEYLTSVTPTAIVIPAVRQFFAAAGVNLDDPGKVVFFNDRLGVLMVRATLQDLDTIEKAVQMLNMAPPQLMIRAKFMEVNQDDNRALGFDWYLGNTLMRNGTIGGQGGTAPSYYVPGSESAANPSGVFPGPSGTPGVPGPFAIPAQSTDNLVTGGLRNTAPTLGTITGILTDPQFRFAIRALEQRGGTDLLACPEVTTMSGRQAQIKIVDVQYIVTDLDLDQTSGGGFGQATVGTTGGGGVGSSVQPIAEPFELGPVLDVVPYVNADGYTIQLTMLPTLKEFLGYDDPGAFVAQIQSVGGTGGASTPLITPTPLPKFRLRQVATTAMVWDGQTVVLGGLIAETVNKQKDKVPMLGDLPFLGRFFRSESNNSRKKNLVIFVTPTLIDPAGNRLHSEEEMPFAQNAIPPQPTAPRTVTQ